MIGWLRGHSVPSRLLFVASVILVSYRFANSDLFSFVFDEPQFLEAARAQLTTGEWVSSGFAGNQGLHYGPATVWLHGVIDMVSGPEPEIHIQVMTLLMVTAHIILALGLGRLYGDRILVSATVLALLASSPYQFLWSRMAWDELVDVSAAATVGLLCWRRHLSAGRALAIGVLLGIALLTHLMVSPLMVFLLVMAVAQSPRGSRIVNTVLIVAGAGVINIPYAIYLAGQVSSPTPGVLLNWGLLLIFLQEPVRVATLAGVQEFFQGDWTVFSQLFPTWGRVVDGLDTTVAVLAMGFALMLVLTMIGASTRHRRRTATLALAVWIGYAIFFTWRGQRWHGYYQWTSYWIVPVAVAGMCHLLRRRMRWLRPIFIGLVWVCALFQMQFLTDWMHFIRDRGGTRGTHYGTVLSEQQRLVRLACQQSAGPVALRLEVTTFIESLSYLAAIEPACFGKKLYADGQAPPEVPVRTVVYQPGSARYELH